MDRQILLYAPSEKTAAAALKRVGGRLLHVFTKRVFVAELPPGASLDVEGLAVGTHRFQCCIHPWMRAAIKVVPDGKGGA